ncbi:helix-turn-helix domain-containing protein [Streptomyces silvisoli]|uniref:XRE family transcriptional regulator n=1 Tax=Streptomyces silvisoli TaxID=3034235 RepID=A0ABT5ZJ94_9ACTN|nr:XRE family transcriptional regulator [Streptomyces silvisoli]MDF3289644.1 XRE family transcriptional regulator [Streptomyces silvisoli]
MVQAWTPESAVAMGQRIQRLRQERGLSLSELARSAGIGKATLSGLEAGTRNPTLETLYAITGQLGVPLASLLTEATGEVRGAAVTARLLEVFEDATATTELYWLTIRPGRVQHSPAHPAGVTEQLTVIAGAARVGPRGAERLVRAGEHISWAADVPHTYAAVHDQEVQASLLIRQPRGAAAGSRTAC